MDAIAAKVTRIDTILGFFDFSRYSRNEIVGLLDSIRLKPFLIYSHYPSRKWDGNDAKYHCRSALAKRPKEVVKGALAKISQYLPEGVMRL